MNQTRNRLKAPKSRKSSACGGLGSWASRPLVRRISRAGCWASLQRATRHGVTIPDPQATNIETAYNDHDDQLGHLMHDAAAHIDGITWTGAGCSPT